MCLVVRKGTEFQVANEDIICYKKVSRNFDGEIISAIQNFKYELNLLYQTEIEQYEMCEKGYTQNFYYADYKSQNFYCNLNIEEIDVYNRGFHSYKTKERASSYFNFIVECTIPKGSIFIEDETGLICSNQIIINKIL